MAGLIKKKIRVRSKSGKSFLRSIMVRSQNAVKQHGSKVLAGAALLGGAYMANKNKSQIGYKAGTALHGADMWRRSKGATLAGKIITAAASSLASHYGEKAGRRLGEKAGKRLGGKHGRELGGVLGESVGGVVASHIVESRAERAAKATTAVLRKKNPFARARGRK